jgi:hypothetical protein
VRQLNLPAGESFFNGQIKADEGKGYFYGLGVAVGGLCGEGVNDILMNKGRVLVGERVIGKLVEGFLGGLWFCHKSLTELEGRFQVFLWRRIL